MIFENGDKVTARVIHVTNLTENSRSFRRQNELKLINNKVISMYNKKTAIVCNSHYVHSYFDLGGGVTLVVSDIRRWLKLMPIQSKQ